MMLSCAIVALFGAAHAVPVRWSNLVESGQTHLYTYDNYVAVRGSTVATASPRKRGCVGQRPLRSVCVDAGV